MASETPPEPHAPRASGAPVAALGPGSVVRDVASGSTTTYDEWLRACSARENRPHEECVEQLMNAIARGDVTIVDAGAS